MSQARRGCIIRFGDKRGNMRQCHRGRRILRSTPKLFPQSLAFCFPDLESLTSILWESQLFPLGQCVCRWAVSSPITVHRENLTEGEEISAWRRAGKRLIRKKCSHSALFSKYITQILRNFRIFASLRHYNHGDWFAGRDNWAVDIALLNWVYLDRGWWTNIWSIYLCNWDILKIDSYYLFIWNSNLSENSELCFLNLTPVSEKPLNLESTRSLWPLKH